MSKSREFNPSAVNPRRRELLRLASMQSALMLSACASFRATEAEAPPPALGPVNAALLKRMDAPGKKKVLALDGGGILGLVTVETLASIESQLRQSLNKPDLVLADYFDLMAGTSTGAIIATCLSMGMSVDEVRSFYVESGKEMFHKAPLLERFYWEYRSDRIAAMLKAKLGAQTQLGSDRLRTLLLLVLKNANTGSAWPLTNNPRAIYNLASRPTSNLRLPLWKLVRGSTAAPSYFPPEQVDLGEDNEHKDYAPLFIDGGTTPYNDPAFLAFLTATLPEYQVKWKAAEKEILVISIGTGDAPNADPDLKASDMSLLYDASHLPQGFMFGAEVQQDTLCRVFGRCRYGAQIDREIGDLKNTDIQGANKLFTYVRYDFLPTSEGLQALGVPDVHAGQVKSLDDVDYIPQIQEVGKALGRKVSAEHFEGFV